MPFELQNDLADADYIHPLWMICCMLLTYILLDVNVATAQACLN